MTIASRVFSHAITIYFRADVNELLRGRNLSVIMCMNPTFRGFFRFELDENPNGPGADAFRSFLGLKFSPTMLYVW